MFHYSKTCSQLFIEEDISRCASDVDQMIEEYKQYQQSSQDHDELKRRVDLVNEHWKWLKKTVDKYASKNVAISEQTKKFDNGKYLPVYGHTIFSNRAVIKILSQKYLTIALVKQLLYSPQLLYSVYHDVM